MSNISIDLTELSGWDNLQESATYAITVKAKANHYYNDSAISGSVNVTKPASGYNVTVSGSIGNASGFAFYDGQDETGVLLADFYQQGDSHILFEDTLRIESGYLYAKEQGGDAYTLDYGTPSAGIIDNGDGLYTVTANGSITGFERTGCFVKGTKITLADGSTKNVEDITYDDDLLVWNFYDGKLDHAKPVWIMGEKIASQYKKVTLSDGTILKLVGSGKNCHRLFNVTKQQMLYANECIGDEVYKQDGSIVTVLSCEPVNEIINYYNLTTGKYLDCFAEGVLTGSRLNNMYHITDMKYDSDKRLISEEEESERWAIRERMRKVD